MNLEERTKEIEHLLDESLNTNNLRQIAKYVEEEVKREVYNFALGILEDNPLFWADDLRRIVHAYEEHLKE